MTKALPFEGVLVLDLGQIYQGPYATFLLAQAGADVIKIEPPAGDPLRRRELIGEGPSLPLALLNSNKRGVTLNLKTERGCELLIEMAKKADVLVENFAPGVLDRLGVGAKVLLEANPRLIYASGTGFGLSGPDRDQLAMDLTVQAASGAMSITGLPSGPPLRSGPAIGDFIGGTHLFGALVTALFQRERTGEGRVVEVAMQEALFPSLASDLGLFHREGRQGERRGNRHDGVAPYNVYPTQDGHVALICVTEQHWLRLVEAMGRSDLLEDPKVASNAARSENVDYVDDAVSGWTGALARDEAVRRAQDHGVPCAPVRHLEEVINDRHMHERGMLRRLDHRDLGEAVLFSSPLRFHGSRAPELVANPRLGEHNREVYCEWLGLGEGELAKLREQGVI